MDIESRRKNARLTAVAGLLIALVGMGLIIFGAAQSQLRAWGIIALLAGVLLLVRSAHRYFTKEKLPSQPLPAGERSLEAEDMVKRNENAMLSFTLIVLALLFFVLGCVIASNGLTAEKAGELTGKVLVYWIFAALLLGGFLKVVGAPYALESGTCATAVLFMLGLILLSRGAAHAQEQDQAAFAAEHSLLAQLASSDPIDPNRQYSPETYGGLATPLTITSHDFSIFQRKALALKAREQSVLPLGVDSVATYADVGKRAEAARKMAVLHDVNTQAMQDIHDLVTTIHSDILASSMSESDKQDFIKGFERSSKAYVDQTDAYFTAVLALDATYTDMLDAANVDRPQLVNGHILFHDDANRTRFQADALRLQPQAAKVRELHAAARQKAASYLNSSPAAK